MSDYKVRCSVIICKTACLPRGSCSWQQDPAARTAAYAGFRKPPSNAGPADSDHDIFMLRARFAGRRGRHDRSAVQPIPRGPLPNTVLEVFHPFVQGPFHVGRPSPAYGQADLERVYGTPAMWQRVRAGRRPAPLRMTWKRPPHVCRPAPPPLPRARIRPGRPPWRPASPAC